MARNDARGDRDEPVVGVTACGVAVHGVRHGQVGHVLFGDLDRVAGVEGLHGESSVVLARPDADGEGDGERGFVAHFLSIAEKK